MLECVLADLWEEIVHSLHRVGCCAYTGKGVPHIGGAGEGCLVSCTRHTCMLGTVCSMCVCVFEVIMVSLVGLSGGVN